MKKGIARYTLFIVFMIVLMTVPVCSQPQNRNAGAVGLSKTTLELTEYEFYKISLNNASGKIHWGTSDETVARVSHTGKIKAVSSGRCIITATYQGKEYRCIVKVKELALKVKALKILRGRQKTIQFNNKEIKAKWNSSDEQIATVSPEGVVQAGLYPGTCDITAVFKGKEYVCRITVIGISTEILSHYYKPNKKNTGKILLAGSSSMDFWLRAPQAFAPYEIINVAYGGTTVLQWLEWYDHLIVEYKPTAVVLYVGSNDLVSTDGSTNAENTIRLLKRIRRRLKNTSIYYVSICPCWARKSHWQKISQSNALVRQYCDRTKNVTFLDLTSAFLKTDGTPDETLFLSDKIHPSKKGYRIWRKLVAKRVKQDMKKKQK